MKEIFSLPHHHNDAENEEKLFASMPGDSAIESVASAMKQLGDPSRLRIFWLLCHAEECVTNIAALVNMTSPAVAHHLKLLKTAGLIVARRAGKEVYYRAADTDIAQTLHRSAEEIMKITCPI